METWNIHRCLCMCIYIHTHITYMYIYTPTHTYTHAHTYMYTLHLPCYYNRDWRLFPFFLLQAPRSVEVSPSHVCLLVYVYICLLVYVYIRLNACVCIVFFLRVATNGSEHSCMHACMCICVIRVYVCMCEFIYVFTRFLLCERYNEWKWVWAWALSHVSLFVLVWMKTWMHVCILCRFSNE